MNISETERARWIEDNRSENDDNDDFYFVDDRETIEDEQKLIPK